MAADPRSRLIWRHWTFGERRQVEVVSQSMFTGQEILVVREHGEREEVFVLVQAPGQAVAIGQHGVIEFTPGGPMGGHWRFEACA